MKPSAVALAGAVLLAAATLTGCSPGGGTIGMTPECDRAGQPGQALVLMAQSVPTAPFLPCVRSMPTGWGLGMLEIHKGGSRFTLNSDRNGQQAVTVLLSHTCDARGATQVPSEQPGLGRYERVTRVTGGYGGYRYYVAPGGCVTYHFNLHGTGQAAPVNEASLALGFVTRDAVRAKVLRDTDGRLRLDPPTTQGG